MVPQDGGVWVAGLPINPASLLSRVNYSLPNTDCHMGGRHPPALLLLSPPSTVCCCGASWTQNVAPNNDLAAGENPRGRQEEDHEEGWTPRGGLLS